MSEAKENILGFLRKGIRYDGRKMDEYRPIKVEVDVSKAAEGSAMVYFGDTQVIVGVKLGADKPFSDTPDAGVLAVNAELLPLSSSEFEPGPPGEIAVELARVVDRGIRESHSIDTEKLCIKKGEKVWSVMIDICTINAAGGLIDASALGALAAIKNARFPKYNAETGTVDYEQRTNEKLPLKHEPIAVTVYKINEFMLVDPLPDEEAVMDTRLTITVTSEGYVCSLQKNGPAPLTPEEVDKMVGIAIEKSKELRKHLP